MISKLLPIIHIIVGVFIMLMGMSISHGQGVGLWTSYLNVIFMSLGIYYILRALKFYEYVGKKNIVFFICGVSGITVFCIWFSSSFLFTDLLGDSYEISSHWEHSWCYQNIRTIAESIKSGENLSSTLDGLYLRQYEKSFTYSSLMFIFGGNEPTNICIWNGMHLAIIAIMACLIAVRLGVEDKKRLSFIFFVVLFLPFFDALHIYHRDNVGEALLMIGMYIFVCVYKKPLWSLVFMPLFVFLFYCFRFQYAIVAVLLYFWCVLINATKKVGSLLAFVVLVVVAILLINYINIDAFLEQDLNYTIYSENILGRGGGFLRTFVVGLVGYFPWTNLLRDPYWTYHVFMPLQAMINISVLFLLFLNYKRNLIQLAVNPALMCGLMLFFLGFGGGVGHVSYFAAGMPLLIIGIKRKFSLFVKVMAVFISINFFAGILYSLL